jgi:hypothetical protein
LKTPLALAAAALTFAAAARGDQKEEIAKIRGEILASETLRDADRTLLGEARLTLGRAEISGRPVPDDFRRQLDRFMQEKLEAVSKQEFDLRRKHDEIQRLEESLADRGIVRPEDLSRDSREQMKKVHEQRIEMLEEAELELQLLETQAQKSRGSLAEALTALVDSEFQEADDPENEARKNDARRRYREARAKHVQIRKRIVLEQEKAAGVRAMMEHP